MNLRFASDAVTCLISVKLFVPMLLKLELII